MIAPTTARNNDIRLMDTFPEHPKSNERLGRYVYSLGSNTEHNDLAFDNPLVSRRHACVCWDALQNQWFIKDKGSINGTYINGERIPAKTRYPFKLHQQVSLGPIIVDTSLLLYLAHQTARIRTQNTSSQENLISPSPTIDIDPREFELDNHPPLSGDSTAVFARLIDQPTANTHANAPAAGAAQRTNDHPPSNTPGPSETSASHTCNNASLYEESYSGLIPASPLHAAPPLRDSKTFLASATTSELAAILCVVLAGLALFPFIIWGISQDIIFLLLGCMEMAAFVGAGLFWKIRQKEQNHVG